jgi:rhodanese-related sulfurtransferase
MSIGQLGIGLKIIFMPEFAATTPATVRDALRARTEIALLDVRQEDQFAEGHPLFAASFPLGRLEGLAYERLPRRSVPVVVYGDGQGDRTPPRHAGEAVAAARRLRRLGYTDVSLLAGGLAGWVAVGGELFRDVNAPSKAFGELVAATAGTPSLSAGDVAALLRGTSGGKPGVVVVDARRFDEYAAMSIPTATSVPGAELALRVRELAPDPATTVVVNCAGRTRSIIGAQSLINAGLPNPVVALRNGTIGWVLAGLELDHDRSRRAPAVSAETARRAEEAAWVVAERAGVRRVGDDALGSLDNGRRTLYRFDVRTPQEYESGHRPGFRPAPGGQLVQETDWFAPVRGALMVLADDKGGRAAMTASWLAQMGWEVVVATADPAAAADPPGSAGAAALAHGPLTPDRPPPPDVPTAAPALVEEWLRAGAACVVDVDTSPRFLAGHVPGAAWALRPDLPRLDLVDGDLVDGGLVDGGLVDGGLVNRNLTDRAGSPGRLVLTSSDGYLAAWAAADLADALADAAVPRPGRAELVVLAGGTEGWARSGRPLESGHGTMLSPAIDVYRRPYEGTSVDPAVMQAYLEWEYGLVGQLGRDGTHGFTVLTL